MPLRRFPACAQPLAVLPLLVSCAASVPIQPPPGYGDSKQAAIEVCMPSGQRAYLSRLVCPDGSSPAFSRVGNMGPRTNFPANLSDSEQLALLRKVLGAEKLAPGDPDYHTIDGYEVGCGTSKRVLYLDMYHCQQPPPVSAPKGYTLKPVD